MENNIATGLIFEDDADWDVAFRSQLELFALGSQTLLDTPDRGSPVSPYGDGWDLLWLGHCASQPVDDDYRRFVMTNDKTVPPPNHRVNFGTIPDMSPYDNNTRIMYFSKGSICTYSYALSYRGAQKILKYLSMDVYNKPIDFGLHDMCTKASRKFKCIGVFPQLVGEAKSAGSSLKDSDIWGVDNGDRPTGFSYNIVYSTRLNANAIIDRSLENVTSQWPEDTPPLTGPVVPEFRTDPVENTHDALDDEPDD